LTEDEFVGYSQGKLSANPEWRRGSLIDEWMFTGNSGNSGRRGNKGAGDGGVDNKIVNF